MPPPPLPTALSPQERRLWLACRQAPTNPALTACYAWSVPAAITPDRLHEAFVAAAQHHRAWACTWTEEDGVPQKSPAPASPLLTWETIDATAAGSDEAAFQQQIDRHAARACRQHFDLARGPLARCTLLRRDNAPGALLIITPHLCADAASIRRLRRDVDHRLAGSRYPVPDGAPTSPPPRTAAPLDDWLERLRDAPPALELLTDFPRRPLPLVTGRRVPILFSPELRDALRRCARQLGLPAGALLLAAWQALLHRLTSQSDIVTGLAVEAPPPGSPPVTGFHLDLCPVRTRTAPSTRFVEHAADLAALLDAIAATPPPSFDTLLTALRPPRVEGHSPLFDILTILPPGDREAASPGLLRDRFVDPGTAAWDLTLRLESESAGEFDGFLEYRSDLFTAETARRLVARWLHLLHAALRAPETAVDDLPACPPEEIECVLHTFNATARPFPPGLRLHDFMLRQAADHPDRIALECGDERLTYGQLEAQSRRLAHALAEAGVAPERMVAVMMRRSLWLPVALFGILRAGGAYVPIDPALPEKRIRFLLEDSEAAVILADADTVIPAATSARVLRLPLDLAGIDASVACPDGAAADNLAYMIYTSGSTGQPKGSLIEHRSIVNRLLWMAEKYPFDRDDVQLQTTTISFDVSVVELFMWSVAGARLALPAPGVERDPSALVDAVARHRVTRLHFVPSMMGVFLEYVRLSGRHEALGTLRQVYCSGEALPVTMVRDFEKQLGRTHGTTLHNLYGPTEAAVEVSWFDCADLRNQTSVPIGRPVANTRLYVLDARLRPRPIGCAGELFIGGVQVARGYHKRSELTRERFLPDPFADTPGARLYATGDRARWLEDGTIEYLGRNDFQIKIRGVRVEPGEVEAVLLEEKTVGAAAVVAVTDPGGDTALAAYVAPAAPGSPIDREALMARLRAELPAHSVPAFLIVLPRLPRGPTGKLDRRALPPPTFEAVAPAASRSAEDPLVDLLETLWCDTIGLQRPPPAATFFALGGHSLLALRLLNRIHRATGTAIPLADFLRDASLAGLVRTFRRAASARRPGAPPPAPVPRSADMPASTHQRRLWYQHQLDATRFGHNILFHLILEGRLDPDACAAAIARLVARHEALRTVFRHDADGLRQRILPPDDARVPRLAVVRVESPEGLRRRIEAEYQHPFDLETGPLFRASLLSEDPARHHLLLTVHHIIADEPSEQILYRDFAEAYTAALAGEASAPAPPRLQPADFAAWEHRPDTASAIEQDLSWWLEYLSPAPPSLDLPTDFPRPRSPAFRGARVHHPLSRSSARALEETAARNDATPFMALLAAWGLFIGRLARRRDVIIGVPFSLRAQPGLDEPVGFFLNTLPVRLGIDPEKSFAATLATLRGGFLEAVNRATVPFDRIAEATGTSPDTPLFRTMLVMRGEPTSPPALPGLEATVIEEEPPSAKTDLTLFVSQTPAGLKLSLEYRTDLFAAETAAAWLGSFAGFLDRLVHADDRPTRAIPAVGDDALARLRELGTGPRLDLTGKPRTLHELALSGQPLAAPDAPAIIAGGHALTHEELAAWSLALARRLAAGGVGTGSRVGLLLERSPALVAAMLAVLRAGAAYVPLAPTWPSRRILATAADADIDVLATTTDLSERLATAAGSSPLSFAVLTIGDPETPSPSAVDPLPEVGPDQPAYLLYTSGSTGNPKAVVVEHQHAVASTLARHAVYGGGRMRFLLLSPPVFDSSVAGIYWTLSTGGTLVLPPPGGERDPDGLARLIGETGVTHYLCLPSLHDVLLPHLAGKAATLRAVVVAGEACPSRLPDRHRATLPGVSLINEYGPTEATVWTTWADITRHPPERPVPIGRPIPGATVELVDECLQPVPPGAIGEILIGGAGVARGYFRRDALTRERFLASPTDGRRAYRSGDLARWNRAGELEFLGRADEQIKVRGHRIEPGEIDAMLRAAPGVDDAAVAVVDRGSAGFQLAACIAGPADPAAGRDHAQAHLPDTMIPTAWIHVAAIPRTASGKVDRGALSAEAAAALARTAATGRPPRSPAEKTVAAIWRELLGRESIAADEDFFAVGGHSLLVMHLQRALQSTFDRPVALADLLIARTVEAQARLLAAPASPTATVAAGPDLLRGAGRGTPLFNIPGYGGIGVMPRELAEAVAPDRPYFDGIILPGVDGSESPLDRVETIAEAVIRQIRRVQPHGPYALTGFCIGGVFAYEVARRLRAAGEDVRALVLWHTFPFERWPERNLAARWRAALFAARPTGCHAPRSALVRTALRHTRVACGDLVRSLLRREATDAGGLPGESADPWQAAQARARHAYQMPSYDGRLRVIRARRLSPDDALRYRLTDDWGWRGLVRPENFALADIDCEHMEMIRPPHLAHVVRLTAQWLREADTAADD